MPDMPTDAAPLERMAKSRRGRGGGRSGNARRGGAAIKQMPWNPPVNIDRPTEPVDEDGVRAIHDAAMTILEEIGIVMLHDEAVEILVRNGATADGQLVFMGRAMVMEKLALVPSSFTITPRNPDRAITIGGQHIVFGNVSSPPTVPTSRTVAAREPRKTSGTS